MAFKPILTALLLGACAGTVWAEEKRIEEGVVRKTREVINDSDVIYGIIVSRVEAGACGEKFDLYEGKVVHAFRGNLKAGSNFEFCGYAGLTTYGSYAIGLNFDPGVKQLVFMPDAVYLEYAPGEYFRMISYESHEHVINGKRAILLGFEEPNFIEMLSPHHGQENARTASINSYIRAAVSFIKNGNDEKSRVDEMVKLLSVISKCNTDQLTSIDNDAVDSVSGLLVDRNDAIKVYAARILGVMGARAERALPALNQALEDSKPKSRSGSILPAASASDEIEHAIRKVGRQEE